MLNKTGDLHLTVNHSKNFVNPVVKAVRSQLIECTWRVLKEKTKRRGYRTGISSSIGTRIAEFQFRRNVGAVRINQLIRNSHCRDWETSANYCIENY